MARTRYGSVVCPKEKQVMDMRFGLEKDTIRADCGGEGPWSSVDAAGEGKGVVGRGR